MIFRYKVKAEITRYDNDEIEKDLEACCTDTFVNEFIDKNPLIARKAAFTRAESYEDSFQDAHAYKSELFFVGGEKWYSEYNISVYFIDPKTDEELEIHNTRAIHDNVTLLNGKATYDPLHMHQILNNLKKEFKILQKNNCPTSKAKKIEVMFLPEKKKQFYKIFPTEIIKKDKMTVSDIEW